MKPDRRRNWISPSTRKFFRESRRTPGYSLFDWLHGYAYGRWPYLYIGIGTGEHPLSKKLGWLWDWLGRLIIPRSEHDEQDEKRAFADTYHGKVVPLEAARQLVMVQEEIRLPDLEKIIPYNRARALILKNPDHIVVLECPCRASRQHPCLPLDVCLIVGEPFASFVVEHHPQRARWISREQALDILQAEDERGHVHHAFFKDAMLGRFYAICNCCACCCGAMQAQRNGTPMLASSGYLSQVDEDLCLACGTCVEYCQFGALDLDGAVVSVDPDRCMGCGVCVSHCDQDALELVRQPSKGEPLEIFELLSIR
jgi:Pyruvate/2-oxoacid:ferredoxin oxidoreductase delta subunit